MAARVKTAGLVKACRSALTLCGQTRVLAQGIGKTGLTIGGSIFEQRVHFTLQPVRIEVEHRIGKAFLGRRLPIVNVPRLQQKHVARRAEMADATAIELLHTLLGNADKKTVMPVRIVGVPLKVSTNRFNPGIDILGQLDPVAFIHGGLQKSVFSVESTFSARCAKARYM